MDSDSMLTTLRTRREREAKALARLDREIARLDREKARLAEAGEGLKADFAAACERTDGRIRGWFDPEEMAIHFAGPSDDLRTVFDEMRAAVRRRVGKFASEHIGCWYDV